MTFNQQVEKMTEVWAETFKIMPRKTKVKVLYPFADKYAGINWNPKMTEFVGRIGTIRTTGATEHGTGVWVDFEDDFWVFPFSVLEIIESKEPIEVVLNDRYTAVVTDKVVVGCQTLTEEHLDAIEAGIKQYQSKRK